MSPVGCLPWKLEISTVLVVLRTMDVSFNWTLAWYWRRKWSDVPFLSGQCVGQERSNGHTGLLNHSLKVKCNWLTQVHVEMAVRPHLCVNACVSVRGASMVTTV